MKKLVLLTALGFALTAASGYAATAGTFGYGIEITGTGALATNNGVETLYALDNGGGSRLLPNGTSATLSTSWTSASTAATPTFSLGTFLVGDTLTLNGASILTYKNSGDDVTSTYLNYRITPGIGGSGAYLPGVSLAFNQDNVSGNNGDQRWADDPANSTAINVNLLAGLAPGVYTLTTYGVANANSGSYYESNSGADYAATFIVVPEPSSWAMMLGGLGLLIVFRRLGNQRV